MKKCEIQMNEVRDALAYLVQIAEIARDCLDDQTIRGGMVDLLKPGNESGFEIYSPVFVDASSVTLVYAEWHSEHAWDGGMGQWCVRIDLAERETPIFIPTRDENEAKAKAASIALRVCRARAAVAISAKRPE